MRAAVVGLGATGARAARQLAVSDEVGELVVAGPKLDDAAALADELGTKAAAVAISGTAIEDADVAVLAGPVGTHVGLARRLVRAGVATISTSDSLTEVRALLGLSPEANERRVPLVLGAGFSPGLSCVLARHAGDRLDRVEEVHVAKVGAGGPACARQHHRALGSDTLDWRDGGWQHRKGGSGRELFWFPDPVGGADCYRAALPDPLLLVPAFEGVTRVTARVAATRQDRLTSRLPMLAPPPAEGGIGAVRAEVRGRSGERRDVIVFGAVERPAIAAGAVAAVAAVFVGNGTLHQPGAAGLAALVPTTQFLGALADRGVTAAVFEGASG